MNKPIVEINLKNILYNYNTLANLTTNRVIAVVKADAYGHDAAKVSKYLEKKVENLYAFAVAKLDEALQLRKSGVKSDIIILSEIINKQNVKLINTYSLTPVIFDEKSLDLILKHKIEYALKLDTGMNRLGFKDESMQYIKSLVIKQKPSVIMTHFSVAEDNETYTSLQVDNFNKMIKKLKLSDVPVSMSNSSALINGVTNNIPRIGISMYGVNTTPNKAVKLKPTMSVLSHIIAIKDIKKGSYVSYGNTLVKKDTRVAIVAVGYADGYSRNLSNTKAYALTKHGRISLLGKVCMDMVIFDIKDFELSIGDEVLLYGENKFGFISIEQLANKANTISYEFFTNRTRRFEVRYIK